MRFDPPLDRGVEATGGGSVFVRARTGGRPFDGVGRVCRPRHGVSVLVRVDSARAWPSVDDLLRRGGSGMNERSGRGRRGNTSDDGGRRWRGILELGSHGARVSVSVSAWVSAFGPPSVSGRAPGRVPEPALLAAERLRSSKAGEDWWVSCPLARGDCCPRSARAEARPAAATSTSMTRAACRFPGSCPPLIRYFFPRMTTKVL